MSELFSRLLCAPGRLSGQTLCRWPLSERPLSELALFEQPFFQQRFS
jgi:hypothetical protein